MTTTTSHDQSRKATATRYFPERRILSVDRRATWRGSRRDADWLTHLREETAARRETVSHDVDVPTPTP